MDATFVVTFSVRRGLGPQWDRKDVTIYYDDIDPEQSDASLESAAIADAKIDLHRRGFHESTYIYQDIERT